MANIIELRNASFTAQDRQIVKNISLEFEADRTTAIIGPSGSGKSTVLKLAAGLLVPDEGEILFRSKNVAQMNRAENLEFRRQAAVVFQDSALWANQNLFQILELPLRIHFPDMRRQEREQRIEAVVTEVGYKKDLAIRPAALSAGEQKLIGFARALLCNPVLLFLDEWIDSLDGSAAGRLVDIVRRKQSQGISIILVSHDMHVVKDLADVVVMVIGGQVFSKITREQIAEDDDLIRYANTGMTS